MASGAKHGLAQKGSSSITSSKRGSRSKTDPIRFRTTLHNTVYNVFKSRGWKETDSELDWDIFWADKEWIREVYDHVHLETIMSSRGKTYSSRTLSVRREA
jgi:hypothetical protein